MPVKVETIDHRRLMRKWFSLWLAFLALALASIVAEQAHGQEGDYLTLPMPEPYADAAKLKRLESQISLALSDAGLTKDSASWKAAEEYYTRYMMYLMAQEDAGVKVTEFTYTAMKNLERAAQTATPAFRTALQGWIKTGAQRVAAQQIQGKYFRPASRINATLILANLDAKPAQNGQPPVPDVSVAQVLVQNLYENAEAPTGVRVVALSGIRRQSVLLGPSMAEGLKNYYLAKGKELVEGKLPAGLDQAEMDAGALGFMQRYAVDIVRALGGPEDQKWLAAKLSEIVANKDASPVIALYSARTIPKLEEGLKELPVSTPTVVGWGDRAAEAVASELKRLKGLDKPAPVTPQQSAAQAMVRGGGMGSGYGGDPSSMYGGMGMEEGGGQADYESEMGGMAGMGMGMDPGAMMSGYEGAAGMGYGGAAAAKPQPPEVIAARRRINANLEALLLGLAGSLDVGRPGPGLAAAAQDKAVVEELMAALRTAAEEINNPAYDDRKKFLEILEANSQALDKWVKARRPAADAKPASPDVAAS